MLALIILLFYLLPFLEPWLIDGAALADSFKAHKVVLLNDFVGIGYGLLALSSKDLQVVHPGCGKVNPTGVKAVIGAGTGLGECFLTHNGRDYDVWPAEGGHADFAPRNRTEFEILEHILHAENAKPNQTHPLVTRERRRKPIVDQMKALD